MKGKKSKFDSFVESVTKELADLKKATATQKIPKTQSPTLLHEQLETYREQMAETNEKVKGIEELITPIINKAKKEQGVFQGLIEFLLK